MFQILTRLAVKRAEPILVTTAHKKRGDFQGDEIQAFTENK